MDRLYGWTGLVMRIDLSLRSAVCLPTVDYIDRFIGGRGLAGRMYWNDVGAGTGAFDQENHLYFMTGPLCATPSPASSRWVVVGKSPMADPEQYASGNLGGHLGAALKWAGLDGLDILGASAGPVVLVVEPGGACLFEDASFLWGMDAFSTIEAVQAKYGHKAPVATIGRAGERLVRYAAIIGSGGVSATKGFGAVMGSKQLKAVVVRAEKRPVPVARPDALKHTIHEIRDLWKGEQSERYWNDLILEDVTKESSCFCYSCPGVCRRGLYRNTQGEPGYRKSCVSAFFYSMHEKLSLIHI